MNKILNYLRGMDFVSKLLILLGFVMMVPLVMLIFYPEDHIYASNFIIPGVISIIIGLLFRVKKPSEYQSKFFGRNHESVVVVGIWIYAFVLGAVPFVLSGQLDFVNALFETVSGWTTTGLSVMNLNTVPMIFMFYRGFMQFCGGLGFILLMLLFASGSDAMKLFSAEGHQDKLEPNLRSTAKTMMLIYVGSILLGVILYLIAGMPIFDSVFHAMTALSTGGFGMTADSIAVYNNIYIEIITMLLMIIGTTNFAILALLIKGKFKKVLRMGEIRFFALLLVLGIAIIGFAGLYGVYMTVGESFRAATFQIISALSTTGFSTIDFNTWSPSMLLIVIIAMWIGGGAGSTAGGIKYSRIYAMWKSAVYSLKRQFMPERSINETYIYKTEGKTYLTSKYVANLSKFIFIYFSIYMIGTLLLTFSGIPITRAMFEFASALGTVGLSIGITGPGTSNYILIIEMIGMFLGRLEIMIILVSGISLVSKTVGRIFKRS